MEQTHWKGLEIVTMDNYKPGAKVVKGKDFNYPEQGINPDGTHSIGTLVDKRAHVWTHVEWANGEYQSYSIGDGRFDLVYLE